jgi:hypothetical protein
MRFWKIVLVSFLVCNIGHRGYCNSGLITRVNANRNCNWSPRDQIIIRTLPLITHTAHKITTSAQLFLRKLVWGIPAQTSGINHVTINAYGAPVHSAYMSAPPHHCKFDADSVTFSQMARRRFGCYSCPPLTLREPGAQNYLRLPTLASLSIVGSDCLKCFDDIQTSN